MAQHDYVIDNQSFPATRTDLNNVLQAIVSNNSGTSAPSTTFANQIWYDSSANILYIRNEDNDANIPLMQFDQSADVAATLATVIDILDASGTDQAGTALTIRAGAGTGTGAGGSIIFQTADGAGSTGSSVNSHATQVTITDDGKVGIGTSTPEQLLNVAGAGSRIYLTGGNEDIDMDGTANGQISIDGNGYRGAIALNDTAMNIYHNSSGRSIIFGTDETERMRINAAGRVMIGTTSDGGELLQVRANRAGGFYAASIHHDGNDNGSRGLEILSGTDDDSGTNRHIDFHDGDGTSIGAITSSGGNVLYSAFTAQHPCILPDADNEAGYPYGTLLEITSLSYTQKNGADTERGLIYNVRKTQSANSKAVLGAYGGSENGFDDYTNKHSALVLGDGHVLCNNSGGNISMGDGICSSAASGIGQKATANPSMIIGIAQEDVTFANDTETKLVAVQYGLQQFVPWS